MTRCRPSSWGVALAAIAALVSTTLHAQTPGRSKSADGVFRGATDLVVLQVTVVDSAGKYASGLVAEDFAVSDEGQPQTLALFATAETPLDLMLLLDTSGSMRPRMEAAQNAALTLMRVLRRADRAAFVTFDDRVRIVQPFTSDADAVRSSVLDARASGRTSLHEALYIALKELARERRGAAQWRRQALVVLSDGDDTASRGVVFEDVLAEARRSGVTVYTIMPGPVLPALPSVSPPPHLVGAAFTLRALADETGGRSFVAPRGEDLTTTYVKIAEELSQQYWLAYPAPGGSGFRRVSVQVVARPEMRARTRRGYDAGPPRRDASR